MANNSSPAVVARQLRESLVFEAAVGGCHVHRWQGRLGRSGPVVTQYRTQCLHCDGWSPSGLTQLEAFGWGRVHGASHAASRVTAAAVPA